MSRGSDSQDALRRVWMEGYGAGLRACGERFAYNNGSANALNQEHNVIDRCRLPKGHAGEHVRGRAAADQAKQSGARPEGGS